MLAQKLEKISYSNISTYVGCPHQWFKHYIQGLRVKKGSIDTIYGTAIHEAIQQYLKWYYETPGSTKELQSNKQATINKYVMYFINRLQENKTIEQTQDSSLIIFDEQVEQYAKFGLDLLTQFIPNTSKFFKKKDTMLFGIEVQLNQKMDWSQINFCGYLDIVLYNKKDDKYKIIDLKTSRRGWSDREKNDIVKRLQLQLYKYFFSRKMNIPMKNIQTQFLILKKQLFECKYKLSRLQRYQPPSSDVTINKSVQYVKSIMDEMQKVCSGQIESKKNVTNYCDWCPYSKPNFSYKCNKNRKMKITRGKQDVVENI